MVFEIVSMMLSLVSDYSVLRSCCWHFIL